MTGDVKLVFHIRRDSSTPKGQQVKWQIGYTKVENGMATFGVAGGVHRGEYGLWVGHTDCLQKSDCETLKEARSWVEDAWKRSCGY